MPTYGMGEAIREMRLRLGYTQEELAYGICTPGTLSRIENGKAIMSKQVFEALWSRMPGLHHAWISCEAKKEMQRSKLCKQTLLYLAMRMMPDAKQAMEQYRCLMDEKNHFCLQFAWYTQAIYQAILQERESEILPELRRALKLTMPHWRERLWGQKRIAILSYDEIYILSNMGIAYARQREMELSFQILFYLKDYLERQNLDWADSIRIGPMIFGNLAWLLEKQGRYNEAVKQCDHGIRICCFTGNYTVLPQLLCIKAWCITASGNQRMAEKSIRQAEAILDITDGYRGYGSFGEFYKAKEPIFVTF